MRDHTALQIFLAVAATTFGGARWTSVAADAVEEKPAVISPLPGTSWQLVKIMSMDDTVYKPDDPARYTLAFGGDDTVKVRADCNRGTGSWSSDSMRRLRFESIVSTKALCPPGSLHDRYLRELAWVRSYVLEEGHFFLATKADGSIIEFEPGPPLAAIVLGEEVRTTDADEMQSAILQRLFAQYADTHGIEATDAEVDNYIAQVDRLMATEVEERRARLAEIDRRMQTGRLSESERDALRAQRVEAAAALEAFESSGEPSVEEATEIAEMRRRVGRSLIERWKINRALYREFGGRIIFQQAGLEPLDAYRRFLEQCQRDGAFSIRNGELESAFWHYFRDDSVHSFVEPGSAEEAAAFDRAPWQHEPD